jgi:hypothetical protein
VVAEASGSPVHSPAGDGPPAALLVIERGGPDMWYLPQVYGLHEAPDLEP